MIPSCACCISRVACSVDRKLDRIVNVTDALRMRREMWCDPRGVAVTMLPSEETLTVASALCCMSSGVARRIRDIILSNSRSDLHSAQQHYVSLHNNIVCRS